MKSPSRTMKFILKIPRLRVFPSIGGEEN